MNSMIYQVKEKRKWILKIGLLNLKLKDMTIKDFIMKNWTKIMMINI